MRIASKRSNGGDLALQATAARQTVAGHVHPWDIAETPRPDTEAARLTAPDPHAVRCARACVRVLLVQCFLCKVCPYYAVLYMQRVLIM